MVVLFYNLFYQIERITRTHTVFCTCLTAQSNLTDLVLYFIIGCKSTGSFSLARYYYEIVLVILANVLSMETSFFFLHNI